MSNVREKVLNMLNEVCSTITIATTGVSCVSDFHDSSIIRHANYEKKKLSDDGTKGKRLCSIVFIHTHLPTYIRTYIRTYIHTFFYIEEFY